MKYTRVLMLLLGMVGFIVFWAYSSAFATMYPDGGHSFAHMFHGLSIIALLLGVFIPQKSFSSSTIPKVTWVLLACVNLTIASGIIFSHDIKTKDYLFYFLVSAATALVFMVAIAGIIRFLILRSSYNGKEIIQTIFSAFLGATIGYLGQVLIGSVESISLWIMINLILLGTLYLDKKRNLQMTS